MSKYVQDIDHGWKRIREELKVLDKGSVKVGILSDAAPPEKGKMNMAKLATIHEYGWPPSGIPPRPFMRQAFDTSIQKINQLVVRTKSEVFNGRVSARDAFSLLGVFFVGQVKKIFRTGEFEPNKPATIKAKGSDKPLIDTGRLRNSIDYELDLKP